MQPLPTKEEMAAETLKAAMHEAAMMAMALEVDITSGFYDLSSLDKLESWHYEIASLRRKVYEANGAIKKLIKYRRSLVTERSMEVG